MIKMKSKILLVEDNRDDEELTLLALEEVNLAHLIYAVHDGVEALDYLFCRGDYAQRDAMSQPHLIMLDLKLPKMSGLEVLQRIKSDPRTHKIPVTVLTSSKEAPDIQRSYDLGANSYIVKPVDYDKFMETIKNLGLYWLVHNQPPV